MKLVTKIENAVNSRPLAFFIIFFAFTLFGTWLGEFSTSWLAEQGINDSSLFGFPLKWGVSVGTGVIGMIGLLIGRYEEKK